MGGKVYGLIGRTLKHSYSVRIHQELGNSAYRLFELEPEALSEFLCREDIGGLNVTIPYKRDVMRHCAVVSPEAQAIGSVNTIVRRTDGLHGYNTDAYGLTYMAQRAHIEFSGRKVVIFGSGGASLTAQAVAKAQGACEVVIVSRNGADNYCNLRRHRDGEILINATPVGMCPNAGECVADPGDFGRCKGVLDLIYNPHRTAFIIRAEQLGIPCSGGLSMLVAQAKAAAELFFDAPIPDYETERILALIGRETSNIVITGMPGSGKSIVGKALGKITGREVVDVDAEIVRCAGKSIEEIFREDGEEEFRRLEREQTALAGACGGRIITTGGGVVKDMRNYAPLHQNGRIYHIVRDLELLDRAGRPLSAGADLEAMNRERLPLYEYFRDAVIENDGTPEEAADRIWRDFCENTCD